MNTENQNPHDPSRQAKNTTESIKGQIGNIDTAKAKLFVTTGVRGHVRKYFPVFINVSFILSLISVLIGSLFLFVSLVANPYSNAGIGIVIALFTAIAGWVGVVLFFGTVYLLMDIRDAVEK